MKKTKETSQISAADFPALRHFLRGYFHQDLGDEYGSPQAAARQFWQDANQEQREAVAEEWERFLARMKGQPIEDLNRALAALGSACLLGQADIDEVSKVLKI